MFRGPSGPAKSSLTFPQPGFDGGAWRWAQEEERVPERRKETPTSPLCHSALAMRPWGKSLLFFFMQIPPVPGPRFGFETL